MPVRPSAASFASSKFSCSSAQRNWVRSISRRSKCDCASRIASMSDAPTRHRAGSHRPGRVGRCSCLPEPLSVPVSARQCRDHLAASAAGRFQETARNPLAASPSSARRGLARRPPHADQPVHREMGLVCRGQALPRSWRPDRRSRRRSGFAPPISGQAAPGSAAPCASTGRSRSRKPERRRPVLEDRQGVGRFPERRGAAGRSSCRSGAGGFAGNRVKNCLRGIKAGRRHCKCPRKVAAVRRHGGPARRRQQRNAVAAARRQAAPARSWQTMPRRRWRTPWHPHGIAGPFRSNRRCRIPDRSTAMPFTPPSRAWIMTM